MKKLIIMAALLLGMAHTVFTNKREYLWNSIVKVIRTKTCR